MTLQQKIFDDSDEGAATPAALTTVEAVHRFITAGRARFTLRSKKSGARFTYKVNRQPSDSPYTDFVWFVSVLSGPDNESDYRYIGLLDADTGLFKWTAKARWTQDAPCVKAITWALNQLAGGTMPDQLEIWHEGRCCVCGRVLTVPESIAAGIGPECASKESW